MRRAERYPGWEFATHVGYSTPEHRAAIERPASRRCTGCRSSRWPTSSWRSEGVLRNSAPPSSPVVRGHGHVRFRASPRGKTTWRRRGRRGRCGRADARRRLRQRFLTRHLRGEVVGLDASEAMVEIARADAVGAFVVGDALWLPFADGRSTASSPATRRPLPAGGARALPRGGAAGGGRLVVGISALREGVEPDSGRSGCWSTAPPPVYKRSSPAMGWARSSAGERCYGRPVVRGRALRGCGRTSTAAGWGWVRPARQRYGRFFGGVRS